MVHVMEGSIALEVGSIDIDTVSKTSLDQPLVAVLASYDKQSVAKGVSAKRGETYGKRKG